MSIGRKGITQTIFVNSNGQSFPISVAFCTKEDIEKFNKQQCQNVSEDKKITNGTMENKS